MSLPNLTKDIKYHTKTLPSGRKFKFAGWRVKDKRELLLKLDTAETEMEQLAAIQDLARSCLDKKDVKLLDELSELDLRSLIVEMRKLSEGQTIDFIFNCPHCKNDNENMYLDLKKDIVLKKFDNTKIEIDEFIFDLQEITAAAYRKLEDKHVSSRDDFNFAFVAATIRAVTYKDKSYPTFTVKEMEEWLESMEMEDLKTLFRKINDQAGYLRIRKETVCEHCQKDVYVVFKEPTSFFVK